MNSYASNRVCWYSNKTLGNSISMFFSLSSVLLNLSIISSSLWLLNRLSTYEKLPLSIAVHFLTISFSSLYNMQDKNHIHMPLLLCIFIIVDFRVACVMSSYFTFNILLQPIKPFWCNLSKR